MNWLASKNGSKIQKILENRDGCADLYRTVASGPSGQRTDKLIGRIRSPLYTNYEIQILLTDGPFVGDTAGWAYRSWDYGDIGEWVIYEEIENEGARWFGVADSLVVGMDVLINGEFANSYGNSDTRRVSPGCFVSKDSLMKRR